MRAAALRDRAEIDDLRSENGHLQKKLAAMETALKEEKEAREGHYDIRAPLEKEIDNLKNELAELGRDYDRARVDLGQRDEGQKALRLQIGQLTSNIQNMEQGRQQVEHGAAEAYEKAKLYKKQLEDAKEQGREEKKRTDGAYKLLKGELEDAISQLELAKISHAQADSNRQKYEVDLERARGEIDRLQTVENDHEEALKNMERLNARIDELDQQLAKEAAEASPSLAPSTAATTTEPGLTLDQELLGVSPSGTAPPSPSLVPDPSGPQETLSAGTQTGTGGPPASTGTQTPVPATITTTSAATQTPGAPAITTATTQTTFPPPAPVVISAAPEPAPAPTVKVVAFPAPAPRRAPWWLLWLLAVLLAVALVAAGDAWWAAVAERMEWLAANEGARRLVVRMLVRGAVKFSPR